MRTSDIEEALRLVRPNLFPFMVEEGYLNGSSPSIKDYFLCPNPQHKDTGPSAHILAGGIKGYCHGCQRTFDILTINHWKNNAPLSGMGFITNNLMPLCVKYDIPFELGDLTEEDRFKIDCHNACRLASDYITGQEWPAHLASYVEERGLTVDFCKSVGIGVVPDYEKFEAFMKETYTTVFLREASFLRPGMFGANNIVFTIKDATGAPVAFISRDMKFEEKHKAWADRGKVGAPPRKYDSTSESNRIYFKRELLFGFSEFLNERTEDQPLVLFEGQFDWAIARHLGMKNCVALGGKNVTPQHLALLRKHKVSRIILVLDGDASGLEGTRKLLLGDKDTPGMLASSSFCKVFVVTLPQGEDPNSFILKYGLQAFIDLEAVDAFEWALGQQDEAQDPIRTCEVVIPFILAEPNLIRREKMIELLSEVTGSSVKAIEDELIRREDNTVAQIEKEKKAIGEEALREFQYGNANPQVLRLALERMEELDRVTVADPLSIDETLYALDEQVASEAALTGPSGYRFSRLTNLQIALNGDCKGVVLAIGGVANTGKTAMQSQLAKELVECNDNSIVIAHTIDDNRVQFNRRLAVQFAVDEAIRIGSPLAETLTLNKMANPSFWVEQYPVENRGLMELREFGYKKLRKFIEEGRLHVKDMTHGSTVSFLEKMVRKACKDFPGMDIVALLDNFHKTQDFGEQDERTATKRKSQYLKTNIAQAYGVTIFSTFEYKKIETGNRPTNNDLREAVNIEYDINYLEHLFSPLNAAFNTGQEEKCQLWHGQPYNKLPIIEGDIGKNKVTEVKNVRHYYKFFPPQSRYIAISGEEAMAIQEMNKLDVAREEGRSVIWKNGRKIEIAKEPVTNFFDDVIPV